MTIPSITAAPGPAPSQTDPATFNTRADAIMAWLSGQLISDQNAFIAAINAWASTLVGVSGTLSASAALTLLGNNNGSSAVPTALTVAQVLTLLGAGNASGIATLDGSGKVPVAQLPSTGITINDAMYWASGGW